MSVAVAKPKLSATKFLEWSASQPRKFELENGEVVEMAAERARHALMNHAATTALQAAIDRADLPCAVFPDGMTVVVDDGHVRLPDAAVQCSPVDLDQTTLVEPVILLEVTSPSSVYRDETHKLFEYFSLPSVHHYLLLSPDLRQLIHFRRVDDAGKVETRILKSGRLELMPPGLSVDVSDLLGRLPSNTFQRD